MKKIVSFFVLVSVTSISMTAYARLGETEEEIETRYGKPLRTERIVLGTDPQKMYGKDGFEILVTYHDGKSVAEEFKRSGHSVSETEVKELLKLNAGKSSWVKTPKSAWHRVDNGAVAYYGEDGSWFCIVTSETQKQLEKAQREKTEKEAAKKGKKLEGF